MGQEDRLKKQVDELGRVLGRLLADLLGLKQQGEVNEGFETANKVFARELGFTVEDLLAFPAGDVVSRLREKNLDDTQLGLVADVMFHLAGTENEPRSRELYIRCMNLYEYLNQSGSTYSLDWHFKINKIKSLTSS